MDRGQEEMTAGTKGASSPGSESAIWPWLPRPRVGKAEVSETGEEASGRRVVITG